MVAPAGIEPATQGFSVLCSTDWAMEPKKMAVPTRIELAIFCVTGRRDNRYTTEPMVAGDGFEPTTSGLWAQRATKLLHPAILIQTSGGERGIRTPAPSPASRFSRPVPSTRLGYFSKLCLTNEIIAYEYIICQQIWFIFFYLALILSKDSFIHIGNLYSNVLNPKEVSFIFFLFTATFFL